jgi:hypothetical protein
VHFFEGEAVCTGTDCPRQRLSAGAIAGILPTAYTAALHGRTLTFVVRARFPSIIPSPSTWAQRNMCVCVCVCIHIGAYRLHETPVLWRRVPRQQRATALLPPT